MDKQKQVDEMVKEKCEHFDKEVCSKLNCKKDCKYYGKSNCSRCTHKEICQLKTFSYCEEEVKEKGCEYYQQELPENAVVLTREEYEILLSNADNAFQNGLNESRDLYKQEVKDEVRKEFTEGKK